MNLPILGSHHELMFKVDDNFRKYINPFNNHNKITPQEHFNTWYTFFVLSLASYLHFHVCRPAEYPLLMSLLPSLFCLQLLILTADVRDVLILLLDVSVTDHSK